MAEAEAPVIYSIKYRKMAIQDRPEYMDYMDRVVAVVVGILFQLWF